MQQQIYTPGEKHIPGTQLKELKGYDSAYDPDFPFTPCASLVVGEELASITLFLESRDSGPGNPAIKGTLPGFVVKNVLETEQGQIIDLHIPIHQIRSIVVKAGESPGGGYELPGKYEYIVALHTHEVLRVEGTFEDVYAEKGGMPEYWLYGFGIVSG